jgi:hypothetical protein
MANMVADGLSGWMYDVADVGNTKDEVRTESPDGREERYICRCKGLF